MKKGQKAYSGLSSNLFSCRSIISLAVVVFIVLILIGVLLQNISSDVSLSPRRGAEVIEVSPEKGFYSSNDLVYDSHSLLISFPEGISLNGFEKNSHGLYPTREVLLEGYSSGDLRLDNLFVEFLESSGDVRLRKVLPKYHEGSPANNLFVIRGSNAAEFFERFEQEGYQVQYNYIMKTMLTPNDAYYSQLWGMENTAQLGGVVDADIDASAAWDVTQGAPFITIGVIDSGVNYNHPDLINNMWTNPGEIPGNLMDDDLNGYIDDVYGYNFAYGTSDPLDDMGHGTHCAGTIAAEGNNDIGVIGACPECRIMALKFLDSGGGGTLDAGIEALYYALDNGAQMTSNSWGCPNCGSIPEMTTAFNYAEAQGMLSIAAAGNEYSGSGQTPPGNIPSTLSVAALDQNDEKADFSNWGSTTDLAAPGVDVLSTVFVGAPLNNAGSCSTIPNLENGLYTYCPGTSMATPHVAGVAGLVLSLNPTFTPFEMKALLVSSTDSLTTPFDVGSGRINAHTAVQSVQSGNAIPIAVIESIEQTNTFTLTVSGSSFAIGGNSKGYTLELGEGTVPTNWEIVSIGSQAVQGGMLGTIQTSDLLDGPYSLRLTTSADELVTADTQIFSVNNLHINQLTETMQKHGAVISLEGSVYIPDFTHYTVEWSFEDTNVWSIAGITLSQGGQTIITEGEFAVFDSSLTPEQEGWYKIRVTAHGQNGQQQEETTVYLDPDLKDGYPIRIPKDPLPNYYSIVDPLIIKNTDGTSNIYAHLWVSEPNYPHEQGELYGFSPQGQLLPNFPIATGYPEGCVFYPQGPISGIDVDSDGEEEIVFPITVFKQFSSDICVADPQAPNPNNYRRFEIHAYEKDGTMVQGFPHRYHDLDGFDFYYFRRDGGAPIVGADVDNDNEVELIAKFHNKLHVLETDGTLLSGQPISLGWGFGICHGVSLLAHPQFDGTPAVGNFDADEDLEIVVSYSRDDPTNSCDYDPTNGNDGLVYVFNYDGSYVSGWPVEIPYPGVYSSPAVGDLNLDGEEDIVLSVITDFGSAGPIEKTLYALDRAGNTLPGWPTYDNNIVISSPALFDIDEDNYLEVVVGGQPYAFADTNTMHVFHYDGTEYEGDFQEQWPVQFGNDNIGPVVYADESNNKLILNSALSPGFFLNNDLYSPTVKGFDELGNSLEWSGKPTERDTHYPPQIADLDNDGTFELIASSAEFYSSGRASIYAWEINEKILANSPWPTFHHDNQRTGRYAIRDYTNINPTSSSYSCEPGHVNNNDGTCTATYQDVLEGYIGSLGHSTWDSAHDDSDGWVTFPAFGKTVTTRNLNNLYFIERGFTSFDTSDIPDGAEITSSKFLLPILYTTGENFDVQLYESKQEIETTLAGTDFAKCPQINPSVGELLASKSVESLTPGFNEFEITNPNVIDKISYTTLCMRTNHDGNDIVPPNGADNLVNYAAVEKVTLQVTYRP